MKMYRVSWLIPWIPCFRHSVDMRSGVNRRSAVNMLACFFFSGVSLYNWVFCDVLAWSWRQPLQPYKAPAPLPLLGTFYLSSRQMVHLWTPTILATAVWVLPTETRPSILYLYSWVVIINHCHVGIIKVLFQLHAAWASFRFGYASFDYTQGGFYPCCTYPLKLGSYINEY